MKRNIYVIADLTNGLAKIGISDDVEDRLKHIISDMRQSITKLPELEIVAIGEYTRMSLKKIQDQFEEYNTDHPISHSGDTEWYKGKTDEIVQFLEDGFKDKSSLNLFNETGLCFLGKNVETLIDVKGEEILFNVKQLGLVLHIVDPISSLDKEYKVLVKNTDIPDKDTILIRKLNNAGETFTTEAGLWSLCMNSRISEAKALRKWVCGEVLPQLRKTGKYINPCLLQDKMYSIIDANQRIGHLKGLIRDLLLLSESVTQWGDLLEETIRLQITNVNGEKSRLIKIIRNSICPLKEEYQQLKEFKIGVYLEYQQVETILERKYGNHKGMLR